MKGVLNSPFEMQITDTQCGKSTFSLHVKFQDAIALMVTRIHWYAYVSLGQFRSNTDILHPKPLPYF